LLKVSCDEVIRKINFLFVFFHYPLFLFLYLYDELKKQKGINNLWKEEQYKEWREEVKKHPEKVGKLHITEDSFTFEFNDKNK